MLHCLGPLGRGTEDENRLAERRRLFLNATRVGKDQLGPPERGDEVPVGQRLDDPDVLEARDLGQDRLADDRVAVDRKENQERGIGPRELRESAADLS